MTSHHFIIKSFGILTTAITFSLVGVHKTTAQKADKPNVLFILADDFGNYDLSASGSRFYETPYIDKIASEGLNFTHGYTTSPVCSPARASLLTGQFPARHGITDWIGARTGEEWRKNGRFSKLLPPENGEHLPHEYVTLPEAMKEAGYKTFFAGKWHIGSEGSWPEDHGFDINIGGWDSGSPIGGYFDPYKNPNLKNRKPGENLSMRLADETVQFLNENNPGETGQPVFAYLSFYAVHGPIQTTREKWKKYRDKAEDLGLAKAGFEMGDYLPIRTVQDNPVYAGLVEAMDDAVGYVLDNLVKLGLDDNTIVIFTSDHGGVSSGDAYATSNLPLRKGKGSTFEGGLRVPYFIKLPNLTENLPDCDVPVTGADFYPTILELIGAGLKPEQHTDGISLVPLLHGEKAEDRFLVWHYPHYGNQGGRPSSVIREGHWKLIHLYETDQDELYNLSTDINEAKNLNQQYPDKVKTLKNKLFSYLREVGARYPKHDPLYDAEAEMNYLEAIKNKNMPDLEHQRLEFLSEDYNPGNNWWGSNVE